MYFISDQRKEEYIGRIGESRIHSYVFKKQQQCLFVRHRDISWTQKTLVTEEEEDTGRVGMFRTANNRRIKSDDWFTRIIHEGCHNCDATFTTLDYRNVIMTDDDKFICQRCADEFHLGAKKETIQ